MDERFSRSYGLIGEDGINTLKKSTVALFGLGGVGSFALEALARSGVGTIYIYDSDTVSRSNLNRQLIATEENIDILKTQAAAKRCCNIDPDIKIIENPVFITKDSDIDFARFDFVIDAVDNITAKLYIAQRCTESKIPMISVMGTGNKLYPERLRINDVFETKECPLCRVMRTELKKRGIKKLKVVWSDERPIKGSSCEQTHSGRPTPSSMVFVPASAGIMAAAFAVQTLINKQKENSRS